MMDINTSNVELRDVLWPAGREICQVPPPLFRSVQHDRPNVLPVGRERATIRITFNVWFETTEGNRKMDINTSNG